MKIIGRGLIANSLLPYQYDVESITIFASGVANSLTTETTAFDREYQLLYETLKSALKSKHRVVYFSSGGAVYGKIDEKRSETTPVFPDTAYGRHKLLCEAIVRESTVPYLILRLPNLVGAKQNKAQLLPALVHQAKQGKVTLYTQAKRDIVDVADFAEILIRLLKLSIVNETIIIASGVSVSIQEIFAVIQEDLHLPTSIETLQIGDQQIFTIDKLRRILNDDLPFHQAYYKEVIRKYIRSINSFLP